MVRHGRILVGYTELAQRGFGLELGDANWLRVPDAH
jgi:hypothetical protein